VLAAWLTRATIDGVGAHAPLGVVSAAALGLAATGVAQVVLPQVDQYLRAQIERAVTMSATERLHRVVDGFVGLGRFEDPRFLDRLRMASMATRTPADLLAAGLASVRSGLTLAGFIGSLAVLSPVMTAVLLGAAVPTLVAELAVSRRRTSMIFGITPVERREMFYANLLTRPDAAKEIRLFGIGALLRARMLAERGAINAAKRAVDRRQLATQSGLSLLAAAVAGGGLVWTILSARNGAVSPGSIALFIGAVAGTQAAISTLISQVGNVEQWLTTYAYLREVLGLGPDLPLPAAPVRPAPLRRGIELDDVWFRYSDEHPWVLRGVSLFIPHGQSVALVGRNGAGKSTIVKLLCRLYDPTRGTVRWDGVDLRDLDPGELRRRITAVFQDFVEYDLTAAENIGVGDVSALADRSRVTRAAAAAGVHDTLAALPSGYDTMLSRTFFLEAEKSDQRVGVALSGGQWQRVALARALMRTGSDLTILDEPSAGLDAEAEYEIHTALARHRAGRTSVLISHRLSAVRAADRIVVIDAGVRAEEGTHGDLMAAGGLYAGLFRRQAAGYTAEIAGGVA
jgi:ATP-binding cassette subfamily B protein